MTGVGLYEQIGMDTRRRGTNKILKSKSLEHGVNWKEQSLGSQAHPGVFMGQAVCDAEFQSGNSITSASGTGTAYGGNVTLTTNNAPASTYSLSSALNMK